MDIRTAAAAQGLTARDMDDDGRPDCLVCSDAGCPDCPGFASGADVPCTDPF